MYNEKHPQAEGTDFETHSKFFWTPFWSNSIPEWVDNIDNALFSGNLILIFG